LVLALLIGFGTFFFFSRNGIGEFNNILYGIDITAITRIYIGIAQVLIIVNIIAEAMRYNTKVTSSKFHPSQMLLMSFILMILIGCGLLMLPRAVMPGKTLHLIDALFMSASAVCVTGLSVVDISSYFTHLGQAILLVLVQIGGIGIMTLSSFLALFFGQGVSIREGIIVNQMINAERIGLISSTIRNVVLITLGVELAGTLVLMALWSDNGWTLNKLIFSSLFHSVCAFCNAGFSTFSDSLINYQRNFPILAIISTLIILGGIGFTVITDCFSLIRTPRRQRKPILKVQSKLTLLVSGILLASGFLLLYLFDSTDDHFLRITTALFNSVTSRTAGFNTIDMSTLSVPSILIVMMLMFIGASPGSTGGGIKTTTIAVLWSSIHAIITGKNRIVIFNRRLPFLVLNRALVIFVFSVAVISVAVLLLSITEKASVLKLAFEAISAYGTVGLTLGITGTLTLAGKAIIILLMFIGRIGALTLVFAITSPTDLPPVKVEYPTESVTIG
jgi:trk system potassium uptake protein TrkH